MARLFPNQACIAKGANGQGRRRLDGKHPLGFRASRHGSRRTENFRDHDHGEQIGLESVKNEAIL